MTTCGIAGNGSGSGVDVRRGVQVMDAELDAALAAGVVQLTRPNARPVRCCRVGCRRLCGVGVARRLWLDGHARGFLCESDCWNLGQGRAE